MNLRDSTMARLRWAVIGVAALQIIVGVIGAVTVSKPERAVIAATFGPPPPPQVVPIAAPVPPPVPGETDAADAIGPTVALFDSPDPAAKPFGTLSNPTFERVPLILHVLEDKGAWLHVRVNTRPNGARAWVRRSEVTIRHVPNRIVIELGARRLTVLHGNDVLTQHSVAVGAPRAPTPMGEFYIDATVNLAKTTGPYGVGQLSVSGFSEVYKTFGGGIGQIAIHGTNNPSSIGGTVSNGCIRMLNDAWIQVASLASNGTPVSIRA